MSEFKNSKFARTSFRNAFPMIAVTASLAAACIFLAISRI